MKGAREWVVRRATAADGNGVLAMMAAFNRGEGIPFRRAMVATPLRHLLRHRRLGIVIVATDARDRTLAGYALGTFGFDLEFAGRDAFVTEFFVQPVHRRAGLGTALLAALIDALHEGGARAATLLVWPNNKAARRVYARAGFKELPRLAMTRRLPAVRSSRGRSAGTTPPR